MKTTYDTPEEQLLLRDMLHRAAQTTEEALINTYYKRLPMPEIKEYYDHVIAMRAKIYEFLGETDPNEHILIALKELSQHEIL